jgi:hypothetical protein
MKWEGLWCPCCGYRLRTRPRNLKYKAKLREGAAKKEGTNVSAVKVGTENLPLLMNQKS